MVERFSVSRIEPIDLTGPDELLRQELMSPYVWQLSEERLGVLVRAVSRSGGEGGSTGTIWYGEGRNGSSFRMDDTPVLMPETGGLDEGGCEDPTVVEHGGETIVFYTGLDGGGEGRLLWASGPDVRSLTRRGVALDGFGAEQQVKEAEIGVQGDRWTMGYEYVRGEESLIGYAEGNGPSGPWRKTEHGFGPRRDRFDTWHLSPGPMLLGDPDHPVMFYNGATRDARWGIGWVVFDHPNNRVLDRCEEPLIAPPDEEYGRAIAFAASLIDRGDLVDLYFSYNDRTLHRAVLVRHDRDQGETR